MDKSDFAASSGDERANRFMSTTERLRARTSSRKRGTSQAMAQLTPKVEVPAKNSSRRKAGAETTSRMAPMTKLSPQSISATKRKGQATLFVSSKRRLPAQPSAPASPEGRAISRLSSSDDLRGQLSIISAHIAEIREQWRRRQMWHRAEKSLTLQAKSMCRRLVDGDKKQAETLYKAALKGGDDALAMTAYLAMHPLLEGRKVIEKSRKEVEKRLVMLAKTLPVSQWVSGVRGLGLLSLAGIVGEAGDLSAYSNPAKLWKRMGLAVMPDGGRQRIVGGLEAIEHGYNPARRSLMWTIGDVIVKLGGEYRKVYDERKAYETAKNERGEYADRAARMLKQKNFDKKTSAYKCYSAGKLPPLHIHNSAKRYMEKRLLRDLWRAWRDVQA